MTRAPMIGIDLGTSNSGWAWFDGKAARMGELPDGGFVLPSVVTIADGQVFVGKEAIELGQQKKHREYCFRHFKRRLAERWNDNEDTGYQSREGENEDGTPNGMFAYDGPDGHPYTPVDLSSYVIRELLLAATDKLGGLPAGAVICVPADFTTPQCDAVMQAARMAVASIDPEASFRIELFHEPTAAALAYGYDDKKAKRIAVFDLGGGTFDVSVIQSGGGKTQVWTNNGIRDLGGINFDRLLADYVINRWQTDTQSDLNVYDSATRLVLLEAEETKKRLSSKDETTFRVDEIDKGPDGLDRHMIYPISRKQFDVLTRGLRERMIAACQAAVDDIKRKQPNFSVKDLHDVLLVGGMTRVRAVREAVEEFFGKKPRNSESVEHVVAMGAAIKAAILEGRRPDLSIADVTSHAFGLEASGDTAAILFPRGSNFPSKELKFTLTNEADGQGLLSIRLIEGDGARASVCSVLWKAALPVIEPGDAKSARVQLLAKLDESGRPVITVGDLSYGVAA